ncbi:dihydropteroate synthase [Marispirochaeta sp.]|jgi:dihydropteroate synthase|uniref:dihydropteroate synthase n=1 Tax=Marispirochaeta sp. TaxID=2038653 RepID=UPI0029C76577|nr:dihydropteroate synthase [Marispirochaeta sp.]
MSDHPADIDFSRSPLIMGIINCTPDSFYPSSRASIMADASRKARQLIEEGAHILDLGGESSRPGAEYVDKDEELRRVIPIVEEIRKKSEIPISIDTRKAAVAVAAFEAGADIINDISALQDDEKMAETVASYGGSIVLMHKRGSPKDMQLKPHYENVIEEVKAELQQAVDTALQAGIDRSKIILDPGIGFGKRHEDNLSLLRDIEQLAALQFPVLIGHSRKSFLEKITGRVVDERIHASIAVGVLAHLKGAAILRVHDVAATLDAVMVVRAIEGDSSSWNG